MNRLRRPGVYRAMVECSQGTVHESKCDNDCLNCMWKAVSWTRVDDCRLKTHVRLCRRNLQSKRVRCCAMCPFEEEIITQYPELQELFKLKREQLCGTTKVKDGR